MLSRLVPLFALLATAIFVGGVIWGGATYPDYDHLRQFISELGATGAVTASPMNLAFKVSSALMVLFWLGAILVLPRTGLTILGCVFSALNGIGLYLAGVYSCDLGCTREDQSVAAVLHDTFGGLGYLAAIIGMTVLAFASTRWPAARGLRALGLVCALVGLIGFAGIVAEPELKGLLQRLLEAAMWAFMLATALVTYRQRRWT